MLKRIKQFFGKAAEPEPVPRPSIRWGSIFTPAGDEIGWCLQDCNGDYEYECTIYNRDQEGKIYAQFKLDGNTMACVLRELERAVCEIEGY